MMKLMDDNYLNKLLFEFIKPDTGIFITTPEGLILDVNNEFEKLIGYSKDELLSMRFRDFAHPTDLEKETEYYEKLLKGELEKFQIKKKCIHKNGKVFWIDVSIFVMKDKEGQISQMVYIVKDVTENVKLLQALTESEEKYRLLLQYLHAGVVVHAANTSIRFANNRALQLLGLTIDQVMGKTVIDPSWHFVNEDLTLVSIEQYPVQFVITNKFPLREKVIGIFHPDENKIVWVLVNAFPEFDSEGLINQVVVTFIDITSCKQAEEALRLANDIVHNVQVGMYVYHLENINDDRTLRMISANPATEEMTGIKVSEIIGKTLDENFPYLRDKGYPQRFAEVVRKGEAQTFEDVEYEDNRVLKASFSVKAFPLKNNKLGVAFENITEKVKAQNEIFQSNNRLKLAQEIGNVGSWEFDIKTNKVTWSDHTYTIYEENPDVFEVNFENVINHYPKNEQEKILEALNISNVEKKNLLIEHEIITGKGNKRFVSESGRLILSENGEPEKLVGTVADITELKTTLYALQESRNLFQQISLISKIGGWNVDLVSGEHNWTELTREIHEVGPDFIPNMEKAISFYEDGESREMISNVVLRCIETGDPFDMEFIIITAKGNRRWVRSMGSSEFKDGKCIKIHGTIQDITNSKQEEEELIIKNKISNSFIKSKQENFYNDVLEIIKIFFECEYGFFAYINEQGDLVPKSMTNDVFDKCQIKDKSIIFPREKWGGLWGNALIEKRTLFQNGNMQFPVGHVQIQNAIASPILLKNDLIGQIVLGNKKTDFNEKEIKSLNYLCDYIAPLLHAKLKEDKIKMDLQIAKEKAEESDRLKSAFLANMSHEIRTPMNGILGFAELLKEPNLSGEEQQSYIKIIDKSGTRMLNIINDIIEISKIEAGLIFLNEIETDLNEILEELTQFFKLEAETKGLKLSIEILLPQQNKNIFTDQNKLDSILTNLIKNAIKYTNSGTIKVGCLLKGKDIEFYIKDTGIGIPEERQKAIFERFIQADITDKMAYQGAGLGLAISKSYVHMLGGTIWVESQEGIGSTFYFSIPYKTELQKESDLL